MSIQSNINAALSDARRVQTEITAKTAEREAEKALQEAKSAAEQGAEEIIRRGTEGATPEDLAAVEQERAEAEKRAEWRARAKARVMSMSGIKPTYSERVSQEARDYVERLRIRMMQKNDSFKDFLEAEVGGRKLKDFVESEIRPKGGNE